MRVFRCCAVVDSGECAEMKIALKPCQHCAFTKKHLGTPDEIRETIGLLAMEGKILLCHEYSEPTFCASHCARKGIKGKRADSKGDLCSHYSHMTRQQMNKCGLGGLKLVTA